MRQRYWQAVVVFILSLFVFVIGLQFQEVVGFDSRFYLFALEMSRHGMSLFPTTYHQPYPDYPVTAILFIHFFATILGGLSKLAAVFPSAIMAALTMSFTYLLGESEQKRWGLYAVCLLLLTVGFLLEARAISLDMYVTLVTTACFYCLQQARKDRQAWFYYLIYPLLFFGFAVRGPIGLVIPTGVICSYFIISRQFQRFFVTGFFAFCLLLCSSILLLYVANLAGGKAFMQAVLHMQLAGRIDNYFLPPYFYFTAGLTNYALAFPLGMLTIIIAAYYVVCRRGGDIPPVIWQLIGWVLIVLIGMSIPGDKKIRYILPVMPAMALLGTYPFIAARELRIFFFLANSLRVLFLLLPGVLLTFVVYTHNEFAQLTAAGFAYSFVVFMLGVLQLLGMIVWYVYRSDAWLFLISVLAFTLVFLFHAEPVVNEWERAANFVHRTEAWRTGELVFYRINPDGLAIKYLINAGQDIQPVFITDAAQLQRLPLSAVIVMEDSLFDRMPHNMKVRYIEVDRDVLGHVKLVVLKRRSD